MENIYSWDIHTFIQIGVRSADITKVVNLIVRPNWRQNKGTTKKLSGFICKKATLFYTITCTYITVSVSIDSTPLAHLVDKKKRTKNLQFVLPKMKHFRLVCASHQSMIFWKLFCVVDFLKEYWRNYLQLLFWHVVMLI